MIELLSWKGVHGTLTVYDVSQRYPNNLMDFTPPNMEKDPLKKPKPFAYAEHGRWIVHCPVQECPGAEFADFETGLFFCTACRNAGVEHRLLVVDLPDEETKALVEEILLRRPVPETRNWMPHYGETIEMLQAENYANGIGVN